MKGLTRNDSDTIAFVVYCFLSGSIDNAELRAWGMKIIETTEDYPLYFLELINFSEPRLHIYDVIGFVPAGNLSEDARKTIDQLALYHKNTTPDNLPPQDAARKKWINPTTIQRFNEVFQDVIEPISSNP